VAWSNPSPGGAENVHETLREVLAYAKAVIVDDACAVPVTGAMAGDDGLIADPSVREQIGVVPAVIDDRCKDQGGR